MQTIQNTVISGLSCVKDKLEERDETLLKRERVFTIQAKEGEIQEDKAQDKSTELKKQDQGQIHEQETSEEFEKFKAVSFELLDIGYHYGQQGVKKVKSLPLYKKADAILDIDDKFALVQKNGEGLYTYMEGKFKPLVENVFFLYDKANDKVTSYINIVLTKHTEVKDYVTKTYTNVQVTISGTWMRMDFDEDGSVSVEDLKKSMFGLYDFLRNFDVIETTSCIKGKLYSDAIAYMQTELDEDKKAKELKKQIENDTSKKIKSLMDNAAPVKEGKSDDINQKEQIQVKKDL